MVALHVLNFSWCYRTGDVQTTWIQSSVGPHVPNARNIGEGGGSRCRDAAGSVRVHVTKLPRIVRHHRQGSCHGGTTGRTTINSTAHTHTMHLSRVERHTEKERQGHHQQSSISFLLDGGGGGSSVVEGGGFVHPASCSCVSFVAVVVRFFRCFRRSTKLILYM